jgi:hypothetical protein
VARTAGANGPIHIGAEELLEAARRSDSGAVGSAAQSTSFFRSTPVRVRVWWGRRVSEGTVVSWVDGRWALVLVDGSRCTGSFAVH